MLPVWLRDRYWPADNCLPKLFVKCALVASKPATKRGSADAVGRTFSVTVVLCAAHAERLDTSEVGVLNFDSGGCG